MRANSEYESAKRVKCLNKDSTITIFLSRFSCTKATDPEDSLAKRDTIVSAVFDFPIVNINYNPSI